ncbi:MAG: ATP:cob(I)alamin adenosyltransferase [Thaumarchaeota archaeon 13_1_40CM_3_38_6]|nr:MAG: ATP:cob(I)alamin adenosyltransferase [Thaumarchaeota archaeon 13_1_40CM_3_38_6]
MLVKIYTKTGDDGTTGLIGGKRIKKSNPRITAYGAIDELNAAIGIILASKLDSDIRKLLIQIQNNLFIVGADLANPDLTNNSNRVTTDMTTFLEVQIDKLENDLPSITYFILPGGNLVASQVHLARAICRRAEVKIVELSGIDKINKNCQIYINRLSDLLFVVARMINKRKKIKDIAWKK